PQKWHPSSQTAKQPKRQQRMMANCYYANKLHAAYITEGK
ncbi:hypothetical protein KR018_004591, partial [Drosophila ironensis]